MPIMSAINPKENMLLINLAKLTVHYKKYEHVGDRQVYGIQVYIIMIIYSKLLILTSH